MTETGGVEYGDMYFAQWLEEQMHRRGIRDGAEFSRLISEHLGREIRRGTVNLWRSKPREDRYTLEADFVHALSAILLVPVEAIVLAEARARGVQISPRALLASSIPAWTDKLPSKDAQAILSILDRLGSAHGHVN